MTSPARTHQALYRRWRAQTFGEIVGQEPVVQTLRNAVRSSQVAQALLFVGPRGTGKTSMARIVAKALNCTNVVDGEPDDTCEACESIREGRALDVIEMDAASNNKVDDIREFLPRVATMPGSLRRKVFIVDEVQRIKEGWDLLLRTLEEPPDHVAFIFCTTDASQIRPAVLSRIQRFDFRPLSVPQIEGKLRRVLEAEGRVADDDAIALVARLAAGGMRDAESMLDQLLTGGADRLTAEHVRDLLGIVETETVASFIDALVDGDALTGMHILATLEDRGRDLRAFLNQAVDSLREMLVARLTGSADGGRPPTALTAAARRLASIDPNRAGPGGLRFQLELALLAPSAASPVVVASSAGMAARPLPTPAPIREGRVGASPRAGFASAPARAPDGTSDLSRDASGPVVRRRPLEAAVPPDDIEESDAAGVAPSVVAPPPEEPAAPGDGPGPSDVRARPLPGEGVPPAAHSSSVSRAASPRPTPGEAPSGVGVLPSSGSAPATSPRHRPAAVSPAAAAAANGAADPALEALYRVWPDIVAWISQMPAVKPLIIACRPIAIDGNIVTLGFPENQAFLKDVAERRRATLEEGVGKYLGRPVAVRCVATNIEPAPPTSADDEAERLLAEARRIFADDLVDVGEVS